MQFPNHSVRSRRKPCGMPLLYTTPKQKTLKPYKVYSYQPLRQAVTRLLKRQGFALKCEECRRRTSNPNFLSDIYDGDVWRDFQGFLAQKHSWCMVLNVNWFQPFSHVTDSVGALYLVLLNLPHIRKGTSVKT